MQYAFLSDNKRSLRFMLRHYIVHSLTLMQKPLLDLTLPRFFPQITMLSVCPPLK